MKSSLALFAFLVAVGVATELCGDAPCVETSVLLQYKGAANTSAPNCFVDWDGVTCQGVFHVDASGLVIGPVDFTPVKAKKSQAKSSPKSMNLPVQDCSCDSDQAFIMSAFPTGFADYQGLKMELEKYFTNVTLLVDQMQDDFELWDRFPPGTPGPCIYFVWFNQVAELSDRNFLETRASEGATVLTNANFLLTAVDLYNFFFSPGSAVGILPLPSPCGTVQMQPSPQPGDTIAEALTAGVPFLPRGIIGPLTGLVLPAFAQVVWTDPVGGDTTILREQGQGLVIWDGTLFVLSDQCGVPLPPNVQTYVENLVNVTFSRACTTTTTTGGAVIGDPHIKTLDGFHYTLLSQGTFLLWQFSGLSAKLPSKHPMNVNWQLYVHFSGHQSFTKGLLLVDKSGGSVRQVLELTSKDCAWRAKKGNGTWSVVPENQMISIDRNNFATGFMVNPKKNENNVKLKMSMDEGQKDIAVLRASCRPSHYINLAVAMKRPGDERYVDGELRVSRKHPIPSTSMLQTDDEFAIQKNWQELGGSHEAASYLQDMDQPSRAQSLVQVCDDQQRAGAAEICSKHLGHMDQADDFFSDCVYDVCQGGEVAAELAAELLAVSHG